MWQGDSRVISKIFLLVCLLFMGNNEFNLIFVVGGVSWTARKKKKEKAGRVSRQEKSWNWYSTRTTAVDTRRCQRKSGQKMFLSFSSGRPVFVLIAALTKPSIMLYAFLRFSWLSLTLSLVATFSIRKLRMRNGNFPCLIVASGSVRWRVTIDFWGIGFIFKMQFSCFLPMDERFLWKKKTSVVNEYRKQNLG